MFTLEAAADLGDTELGIAEVEQVESGQAEFDPLFDEAETEDILPADEQPGEPVEEQLEASEPVEAKSEETVDPFQRWEITENATAEPSPAAVAYEESRSRLERSLSGLLIRKVHLEIEIKEIKAEEKDIVERLDRLISRGPQAMELPLFDSKQEGEPEQSNDESQPSDDPEVHVDDSWKDVSIDEMRLPPGIQSKLEDAGATTIGTLEQLRADISMGRESWPKGIGKAKITTIEDAVLAWLSANRDRVIIEASQAESQETEGEEQPAEEATEEQDDVEACSGTEFGDLNEEQAAINNRAISFESEDLDDLKVDEAFEKSWQSGRDAYNSSLDLWDCPYTPGDEQDAWLKGWMYEELLD